MNIYGLEKLSLIDYDGQMACTVFTGGCNFKCPFCHNSGLVTNLSEQLKIDNDYIFDYLKKRKGLLTGVCVSGGEPTLQPDLNDFILKVKELGYLVKLDTNGTNYLLLKSLIDNNFIDYVAMDIKNSKDNYLKIIGIDNFDLSQVEKSVNLLLENKISYEFRTTLVKEFHTKNEIKDIASWIKGAKKYCLQKFVNDDNCIDHDLTAVPLNDAEEFKNYLQNYIDCVQLRGY